MADALLSLHEAAAISGRKKKELVALVEQGRLPAVRRQGRWLIAREDLTRLPRLTIADEPGPRKASTAACADGASVDTGTPPSTGTPPHTGVREELMLLLDALRQRDEQIARLQEERAHLSGQLGFLQGLLVEREARLRLLEAMPVAQAAGALAVAAAVVSRQEPAGDGAGAAEVTGGAVEGAAADGLTAVAVTPELPVAVTPELPVVAATSDAASTRPPRGLQALFRRFGRRTGRAETQMDR